MIKKIGAKTFAQIIHKKNSKWIKNPLDAQQNTFNYLIEKARNTDFGKDHSFDKIKTHKIFSWINKNGVSQKEMLKTFNCGVGFCLIIKKNNFHKILKFFPKQYRPYIIGEIIKNKSKVKYTNNIRW